MDETLTPQAQARLAELGNLGSEPSLTPQAQKPTFSAGSRLNVNGTTLTQSAEARLYNRVKRSKLSALLTTIFSKALTG